MENDNEQTGLSAVIIQQSQQTKKKYYKQLKPICKLSGLSD